MAGQLCAIIAARDRQWVLSEHEQANESTNDEPQPSSKDTIKRVLQEIKDPFLPVRAHGLVNLRKLILAKDPIALRNMGNVLEIFQSQLHDTDTYVVWQCSGQSCVSHLTLACVPLWRVRLLCGACKIGLYTLAPSRV
jgi:hypothetical protein